MAFGSSHEITSLDLNVTVDDNSTSTGQGHYFTISPKLLKFDIICYNTANYTGEKLWQQ